MMFRLSKTKYLIAWVAYLVI